MECFFYERKTNESKLIFKERFEGKNLERCKLTVHSNVLEQQMKRLCHLYAKSEGEEKEERREEAEQKRLFGQESIIK